MAMVEGSASRVLAGEANRRSGFEQRCKSQRFGGSKVDGAFTFRHFETLVQQPFGFRVGCEPIGHVGDEARLARLAWRL